MSGVRVSPLARKLAAQEGVVLTRLQGSGHYGRILRADVRAAVRVERSDPRAPARATEPVSLGRLVSLSGELADPVAGVRAALDRLPGGRALRAVEATGERVEVLGQVLVVGAPRREPVLREGRLVVGWMLPLGLTTDGSGIDASTAEALLDALAHALED